MNKNFIGAFFIVAGAAYGSLAIDGIYNKSLGYLTEHKWVQPPKTINNDVVKSLGRKPTILLYSMVLIIVGIFILWNRNN